MPLSFTPLLGSKLLHACDQRYSSRVLTPLTCTGWRCKLRTNTEDTHFPTRREIQSSFMRLDQRVLGLLGPKLKLFEMSEVVVVVVVGGVGVVGVVVMHCVRWRRRRRGDVLGLGSLIVYPCF
jgi:hypothetical protein